MQHTDFYVATLTSFSISIPVLCHALLQFGPLFHSVFSDGTCLPQITGEFLSDHHTSCLHNDFGFVLIELVMKTKRMYVQ